MAEANLPPDEVPMYFGNGERVHVIFNFYVNQHLWLAMTREEAKPILDAYAALPKIPKYCQWANFLRAHDELDLGRLPRPNEPRCSRRSDRSPRSNSTIAGFAGGLRRC